MMNAWQLSPDTTAIIIKFSISNLQTKQRLHDLGFQIGESMTCLKSTPFGGPKIYKCDWGIFSIERELAEGIEVQPL